MISKCHTRLHKSIRKLINLRQKINWNTFLLTSRPMETAICGYLSDKHKSIYSTSTSEAICEKMMTNIDREKM